MIIVITVALISAFFLAVGIIDANRFEVVREEFVLPHLKKKCTFVLISDVHNKVYGEDNASLINAVKKIDPDFIILAGDLVTAKRSEDMMPGIELIKALAKDFKVYCGLGNHETKMKVKRRVYGNRFSFLKKSLAGENVIWLENDSAQLPEYNMEITGLELGLQYFARYKLKEMDEGYLDRALGKADKNKCNLLIAHNPDYFDKYAQWGADLSLSGHVHGGIMRLPFLGGVISPSYKLFPKYDGGVFEENGSAMLIGRGVGSHTIPLRFFNPAQLYAVTLNPKK